MRTTLAAFGLALACLPAFADEPRDPFAAYPDDVIECFVSPLQRLPLEALTVQGIVIGTASPRALIVLPDGTSHHVRVGTPVGKNFGQVTAITPKGVAVVEEFRDAFGERHKLRTVLAVRP
jgi:Tfp pilus assembly protein PilP